MSPLSLRLGEGKAFAQPFAVAWMQQVTRALGYHDRSWGDWAAPADQDTRRYRALAELRERFAPNAPLLDLGCGVGHLLPHLPADLPYLGIDCQPDAVTLAQTRCRAPQRIVCGDIRDHALHRDFRFGCVVFSEVLYYQPSSAAALNVLSDYERVIQSPGLFLISIWIDHTRAMPKNHGVLERVLTHYAAHLCATDYVAATDASGWHLLACKT